MKPVINGRNLRSCLFNLKAEKVGYLKVGAKLIQKNRTIASWDHIIPRNFD